MNTQSLGLLIPIIAITMGCAIPLLAIYTDYRKRKNAFELLHKERIAAIEKGIELPPLPDEVMKSFLSDDDKTGRKPRSPHRSFLVGLVLFLLGLACFFVGYVMKDPHVAKFAKYGTFLVAIGLAFLIYYFAVGRKEAQAVEAERKAMNAETDASRALGSNS